jgi:hypothetical protein
LESEIAASELTDRDMMIQTCRLSNMAPIARKDGIEKVSLLNHEVVISRF